MAMKMHVDYNEYKYSEDDKDDLSLTEYLYNRKLYQSRLSRIQRFCWATVTGCALGAGISCLIDLFSGQTTNTTQSLVHGTLLPFASLHTGMLMGAENERLEEYYSRMEDLQHVHDSIVSKYSGEEIENPMTIEDYFDKYDMTNTR